MLFGSSDCLVHLDLDHTGAAIGGGADDRAGCRFIQVSQKQAVATITMAERNSDEPFVACSDAPPVLHPAEHALDDIASAVGYTFERTGMTATASGWDDDLGADRLEWLAEVVRIICLVRQHAPRWSGGIVQRGGDADVGDAARSHHDVMASLMDRRTLIVTGERAEECRARAHLEVSGGLCRHDQFGQKQMFATRATAERRFLVKSNHVKS